MGRLRIREKRDLPRFVRAEPRVGARGPTSDPGHLALGSIPTKTLGS